MDGVTHGITKTSKDDNGMANMECCLILDECGVCTSRMVQNFAQVHIGSQARPAQDDLCSRRQCGVHCLLKPRTGQSCTEHTGM